jgi:putative PIN family toxin of toxin-antitoxin system
MAVIPTSSIYHKIWTEFLDGKHTLCVTTEIMQEYEEVLYRWYPKHIVYLVMELLLTSTNVEHINIYYYWKLINADPDDNKFVDCAISANAKYIVTNDKHFNILNSIDFPKVNIITLNEFAEKTLR